ncbi:phage portal protein [Treponema primitia]|uniref:phage portal protein n=1 Tax=Treponema primitia TaxID=88058 RepID=UPI0002F8BD17|nr:phage portal protein [Treponema primitia]
MSIYDDFSNLLETPGEPDGYSCNAWVHIAVQILIRNIARADFMVLRGGDEVTGGPLFELFRRPNEGLSRFELWKETAAWWLLEGEAFWWFGAEYAGGVPQHIYILDPRRMRNEGMDGYAGQSFCSGRQRWFYQGDAELIPIFQDELIHFRDWNPWNPLRGVNPLISLSLELEQDFYANKANSRLLKNNAVPLGVLKTEQTIRPEEADALERRWEQKYGADRGYRKVAVLGKGTEFKPLSFTPDTVRLFDLKRWNLHAILAKYGIPPRVANINDKTASLSGKDTMEQHAALWKFTIIPLLKNFEDILETQFFLRLGFRETGVFDLSDIPELQESEDAQSNRDIAEINAGLKTINDVLRERGKDTKPWGDIWYMPKGLVPYKDSTRS